jgi:hypothetical protein
MNNFTQELAALDLELSDLRRPAACGQTPEFWKLVENRVKLHNKIERAAFGEQMKKTPE